MEVTVDLHNTELPMVPEEKPAEPLYVTDVFATQEEGSEALIEEIIQKNLSQNVLSDFSFEEGEAQ